MNPEVQETLLQIANDFVEEQLKENDINVEISDVVIIGSITNYNWTPYSDIDLHIMVDFDQLDMPEEQATLMFNAIKANWNKSHNIKIKGHDVEVYVQGINEKNSSESSYSVKTGKWIKIPTKDRPVFDKEKIKKKHAELKSRIDQCLKNTDEQELRKILEKLYVIRQSGLDKKGEFSEENIVFKILRAQGYLDKLRDAVNKLYDREMTIKEYQKIDDGIWPITDDEGTPPEDGKEKIEVLPDQESPYDELVPTDKHNKSKIRNVFGCDIYCGYEVTRGVETLTDGPAMLKAIRHALKHPLNGQQESLVKKLVNKSVADMSGKLDLKNIDVIIPLGSSSQLNIIIAEEISKYAKKDTVVLKDFVIKDVWKNVKVHPRTITMPKNPTPAEVAAYKQRVAKRDLGYEQAQLHLKKMIANNPDDPFEIKNSGGKGASLRQYYSFFYKTTDGYNVDLSRKINGGNVIFIDDTLEAGATLIEALRVINGFKPKSIIGYIFLFGRYGGDTKTKFTTPADNRRQKAIAPSMK